MTEEGWLQNKCNRCGEIFNSVHCPDVRKELLEMIQTQYPLPGIHGCKDGGTGVSELIGYILDPEGEKMALVELDSEAVEILSKIVKGEEYENASDAIRHLNNLSNLQGAIINKQEKEIDELEKKIDRFKSGDTVLLIDHLCDHKDILLYQVVFCHNWTTY